MLSELVGEAHCWSLDPSPSWVDVGYCPPSLRVGGILTNLAPTMTPNVECYCNCQKWVA